MISPEHLQEFQASAISPDIADLNFRSITPDPDYVRGVGIPEVLELLVPDIHDRLANTGGHGQQFVTGGVARLLAADQFAPGGGWVCQGLDPLNDWAPMPWGQFKPAQPRKDEKGKPIKYESPWGQSTRAYFLQGGGVDWPSTQDDPDIPAIITEGAKKTAASQSQGYPTIGLPGVNSGYRVIKDANGKTTGYELIPEIQALCQPGRLFTLAFDQDAKDSTRRKVDRALWRFATLLQQAGCRVRIASWDAHDGKGLDDLIVTKGADAFHRAIADAETFSQWQIRGRITGALSGIPPSQIVNMPDMVNVDPSTIPQQGIIAIGGGGNKGVGKTNLLAELVKSSPKVVQIGHRIALSRHLCQRLGLDYRADLDKLQGKFIGADGFTQRVGTCADSILAIDPQHYQGGTLVIDEVVQVLRHLMKSKTCQKQGRLPALLSRLGALIRGADRVIIVDADLDAPTLRYIQELRGDNSPVYLIRNDYQLPGYPCDFIYAKDASAIIKRLLEAVGDKPPEQAIFVATDSKKGSERIAKALTDRSPNLRILLINSDTSGGELEQAFIQHPDPETANYDVVIASPSLGTGVSITSDRYSAVYGIFYGGSIDDRDMAQALIRVRHPVPRVVWCAERGGNLDRISQATNPLTVKRDLKHRTDTLALMTRAQLRTEIAGTLDRYEWDADPHLNLWAQFTADHNRSMLTLRDSLYVRLKHEGHTLTPLDYEADPILKQELKAIGKELKLARATAIAGAENLTLATYLQLKELPQLSPDQRLAVEKFELTDFYAKDASEVTADLCLWDDQGKRRGELAQLENFLNPELAIDKTVASMENQHQWGQGIIPWTINDAEMRRQAREVLGLGQFINPDREWTAADLKSIADKARANALAIKLTLNLTIHDRMSDTQIVHQLLSQLGLKTQSRWQTINGEKTRVYRLNPKHWQAIVDCLQRRADRRQAEAEKLGSPPPVITSFEGGDPTIESPPTPLPERVLWRGKLGTWQVEALDGGTATIYCLESAAIGLHQRWQVPLSDLEPLPLTA